MAIEGLVDRILDAKRDDPAADVAVLEQQIDALVYALYGLTADEIAVVEGRGSGVGDQGSGVGR